MADPVFTTENGALWVQPGGPNTPVYYLGCHDLGDVEEPYGDVSYEYCRQPDGSYGVVAEMHAPPEAVTAEITGLSQSTRDWLDRMGCRGALYAHSSSCGRSDQFGNYDRSVILEEIRKVSRSMSGLVMHKESTPTSRTWSIAARPPARDVVKLAADRIGVSAVQALNDIAVMRDLRCAGDCGETIDPGERLAAVGDSAVAPATGDALFSNDGGLTWAAGATDPFGQGKHAMSVARLWVGRNTIRTIAAQEDAAGTQGLVAYSDDNGATWTTVNIGGAAAGHGAPFGGALLARSESLVILASALGYIYKSEDGGLTWTAVESGSIHTGDYNSVDFCDNSYGAAVGAAGIVAVTRDGGLTWSAATPITGTPVLNTVQVLDHNRLWVGTATGRLYYSNDFGATWAERTFSTSGAGQVRSLSFLDEYIGFMAKNSAAPVGTVYRTINGGYTWEALTTPTNSGLNAIRAVTENLAFAVGEANGGTAVVLRIGE